MKLLRGLLGIAATWGLMWGAIFATLGIIVSILAPGQVDPGEGPLDVARVGAILGLVSGSAFGVLLSVFERGKRTGELSAGRAALWGALATTVYPLLTQVDESNILIVAPIGAALAAGSIALVKGTEGAAAANSEAHVVIWQGDLLEGDWPDAIAFSHEDAQALVAASPGRQESYTIERWPLAALLRAPAYAPFAEQITARLAANDRRPLMLRPDSERAHRIHA